MRRYNTEPSCEQIQNILNSNELPQQKERLFISIGLSYQEARMLSLVGQTATNEPQTQIEPAIVESTTNANESATSAQNEPILPQVVDAMQAAENTNVFTANSQIARQMLADYTIGVEIECFATRENLIAEAHQNGLQMNYEGYNHTDHTDNVFKLVTDSSVVGLPNSIECVSPVINYGESDQIITSLANTLFMADAKINKTCGLHVHIGAANMTDDQYCNVFVNYMRLESLIESFMPQSRRGSRWAQRLSNRANGVTLACSKRQMFDTLGSRYYEVNPDAYFRHRTIEFRQHSGTTDYVKITNWLAFCVKLCEWSKNNRLTAQNAPQTIDEIEFLNVTEKKYFKARAAHFAEREARSAAA